MTVYIELENEPQVLLNISVKGDLVQIGSFTLTKDEARSLINVLAGIYSFPLAWVKDRKIQPQIWEKKDD